ncbi:MAG: signal peptidase I [Candidatus Pacebacteria bacterium]|nr:signal peptidase I [Candidatus Paceibacterota bacterium]
MKPWQVIYYVFLGLVIAIALLLVVSVLPVTGNYKILAVQSGSMTPAIKMGSVVVVKPQEDYKIGDVITFGKSSKTQTPTTHRIYDIKVNVGEVVYITKGDANNAPDSKEISQKEVIGKVIFNVPYAGYLVAGARTKLGFALIIIIPALAIIIDEVFKIVKEVKGKKDEKQKA